MPPENPAPPATTPSHDDAEVTRDRPLDTDSGGLDTGSADATIRLQVQPAEAAPGNGLRDWLKVQAGTGQPASASNVAHLNLTSAIDGEPEEILDALEQLLEPKQRTVVERELDRGGMGSILVVYDRGLQRRAAMKVLHANLMNDASNLKAFVREAQILGQLDHPNIVPIYAFEVGEDGRPCFEMKLVEGVTLSQMIKSLPSRQLTTAELFDALELMVKLCDALAFAHSRGVLHLDIKPANVMVGDYGQVYLMDWGVAKLQGTDTGEDSQANVSRVGFVTGTPSHMSPEQATGNALDQRTDVFAVGTVIYHLVARKAPYGGMNAISALMHAARCEFTPLDQAAPEGKVPHELVRIVHKALAYEPEDRYPTVDDLRSDIVRFMRGGGEFPHRVFERGQHIVREGELGDAAYIIESGSCEVYKIIDGQRRSLRIMRAGEVFGETAILTSGPRTASVVAAERTVLQVVTKAVLDEEMEAMKPWMGALVRTLAQRFREREEVRADTRPEANPIELARLTLMHCATWGHRSEGGSLTAQWHPIANLLDALLRRPGQKWHQLVDAIDGVDVDVEADTVTVHRPEALRARLEWEGS